MTAEPKGNIGTAFDDFLKEEGIFEEVQTGALKKSRRAPAWLGDEGAKAHQGCDGQANKHQPQPA